MATKKIVASITLHKPAEGHKPFTYDDHGARQGDYKVDPVPPGTPVEINADEAVDLIKRGLAVEALKATKTVEPSTV